MEKKLKLKMALGLFVIWIVLFCIPNMVQANQDIVVLLDPGHGGYDSGASNWPLLEKDVTWKITTRVKAILDSTPGITGVLSRGENECPEIYQRGNMAKSIRSRFSS